MGKKVKKAHLKDVDFRTRKQRSLDWENDFLSWQKDLLKHKESPYAVVQSELLDVIIDGLHTTPAETIEFVEQLLQDATRDTVEGESAAMLCSSVLWYLKEK